MVVLSLPHFMMQPRVEPVIQFIAREIVKKLELAEISVNDLEEFYAIFEKTTLNKPLILILDEFDALPEDVIRGIAGVFRNIYGNRQYQADGPSAEKDYLLHGAALIGVRFTI